MLKEYNDEYMISDRTGRLIKKTSAANLMPSYGTPERPMEEILKKRQTPEIQEKRLKNWSESMKAKKEAKYVAEVTEEVCKRILRKNLGKRQIAKLDIDEFLTEEEKENLTYSQAINLRIAAKTLLEEDLAKAVKGAEYMANYAGEKPADKTDLSVMATKAESVDLLTKALMDDDDEEE